MMIPHYIILRHAVIPLELESKGHAKCFGERREQAERMLYIPFTF